MSCSGGDSGTRPIHHPRSLSGGDESAKPVQCPASSSGGDGGSDTEAAGPVRLSAFVQGELHDDDSNDGNGDNRSNDTHTQPKAATSSGVGKSRKHELTAYGIRPKPKRKSRWQALEPQPLVSAAWTDGGANQMWLPPAPIAGAMPPNILGIAGGGIPWGMGQLQLQLNQNLQAQMALIQAMQRQQLNLPPSILV